MSTATYLLSLFPIASLEIYFFENLALPSPWSVTGPPEFIGTLGDWSPPIFVIYINPISIRGGGGAHFVPSKFFDNPAGLGL